MPSELTGDDRRRAKLEFDRLKRQVSRQGHEIAQLQDACRGRPRNFESALKHDEAKRRLIAVRYEFDVAIVQARRVAASLGVEF